MGSTELWAVYLARCADDSLYAGVAKDVKARLAAHNSGKGAAYTRSRRPIRLVYKKEGLTRSAALVEEARIKALARPGKLALLAAARRRRLAAVRAAGALLLAALAAGEAFAVPTFNKEGAVSLAGASPQSFTFAAPATFTYPVRMFYMAAVSSASPHANFGTQVLSASSADGLAWAPEAGTRISIAAQTAVSASSITGCSVLPLNGGGFRMLYSIKSTTGAFRIHSTTSADGLNWGDHTTAAVDGVTTFVGVPRLVALNSGDWRLYYTRDQNGGNELSDRRLFTARSTDEGATWGASAQALAVSTIAYESGVSKLFDGRIRLFFTQPQGGVSSATVVSSALSDALGATFALETGLRLATTTADGGMAFPVPLRSTDSYRWRLYYSYFLRNVASGDIRSALTGPPDPQSVAPATMFRSATATSLSIAGEIFSPAPLAVQIQRGAATINLTSVIRASEGSISGNAAAQGQELGFWSVVITNADGNTATLLNALLMDFAPGTVAMVGNLLRPRDGTPTTAAITTFDGGRVTANIHDFEGRHLRTIYDAYSPEGTLAVAWDGKDAAGRSAPSGLYLLYVTGPKLRYKGKIVLIR